MPPFSKFVPVTLKREDDEDNEDIDFLRSALKVEKRQWFKKALLTKANGDAMSKLKLAELIGRGDELGLFEARYVGFLYAMTLAARLRLGQVHGPTRPGSSEVGKLISGDMPEGLMQDFFVERKWKVTKNEMLLQLWTAPRLDVEGAPRPSFHVVVKNPDKCEVLMVRWNQIHITEESQARCRGGALDSSVGEPSPPRGAAAAAALPDEGEPRAVPTDDVEDRALSMRRAHVDSSTQGDEVPSPGQGPPTIAADEGEESAADTDADREGLDDDQIPLFLEDYEETHRPTTSTARTIDEDDDEDADDDDDDEDQLPGSVEDYDDTVARDAAAVAAGAEARSLGSDPAEAGTTEIRNYEPASEDVGPNTPPIPRATGAASFDDDDASWTTASMNEPPTGEHGSAFVNADELEVAASSNLTDDDVEWIDKAISILVEALGGEFPFRVEDVLKICAYGIQALKEDDPNLCLDSPVDICGSLQGDLTAAKNATGLPVGMKKNKILFLGGYGNGGNQPLHVICFLLLLKVRYPSSYFLLHGRHEWSAINGRISCSEQTLAKACKERFGFDDGELVWSSFNDVFEYMRLFAIVDKKFFCSYGGVVPQVDRVDANAMLRQDIAAEEAGGNAWPRPANYNSKYLQMVESFLAKSRLFAVVQAHEHNPKWGCTFVPYTKVVALKPPECGKVYLLRVSGDCHPSIESVEETLLDLGGPLSVSDSNATRETSDLARQA